MTPNYYLLLCDLLGDTPAAVDPPPFGLIVFLVVAVLVFIAIIDVLFPAEN